MATRMAAAREKLKLAKNPPVTKYNLDPTTPTHRQSLATTTPAPVMIENRQPEATPQLRYAIPNLPQRSEPSLNRNRSEHKGQSDWLVPFCHHPAGDHETVFIGLFAPCALYGRTHWRLKNVSLGRDPHNFQTSDGCNSMCWIHGALTVACCLSIGLTVIQRARIRAQYRIQGSVGNDIIKSCFCGPCSMMQHDREVRAREGDTRLAKDAVQRTEPQMSQTQPKSPQPMKYLSQRATSAENPGVEDRIFKREPSRKLQKRYTKPELQEVSPEATLCRSSSDAELSNQRLSSKQQQHTRNCEVEALRNHMLMQTHKNAINAINAINAGEGVGKVDGATSSKHKTRSGSERNSLTSLTNFITLVGDQSSSASSLLEPNPKGCERLSRMPARGHLSYIHEFSDYSATKIVLNHFAEELKDLQEKGAVRCLAHTDEENTMQPVLIDVPIPSTISSTRSSVRSSARSSSSSTIRQNTYQEEGDEISRSEAVDQHHIDDCTAESIESAWLLDIPVKHRISSCSVIPRSPSSIRESLRQHRIASCPTRPGTPTTCTSASSVAKDRMLSCTVETAPPSISSSSAMQRGTSTTVMDDMNDADLSTPFIQYSQYSHLLDKSTAQFDSPISRSSSKYRASSCTALSPVAAHEQHSCQGCSAISCDFSPASVKQHRVSSCCASIPSGGTKANEGYGPHILEDCNFTTGSSTPVLTKQHRLTSCPVDSSSSTRRSSAANLPAKDYFMKDGCLLSGAASPIKQHRAVSCGGISYTSSGKISSGSSIGSHNQLECSFTSSGASTPKPRQHRAVSCIASSIIAECEEHILDDCEYDSRIASPLLQHSSTGCDANSVSDDEQGNLLENFAADSGPSTPLRQHRIASCVVYSPSSNKSSMVEQHRLVSCPGNIPDEAGRSQGIFHDSHRLFHGVLVDASENDQSTHTNYEDCLHTLEECITPADRVRMEANASQDTEYEKYSMRIANQFHDHAIEYNEKSTKGKECPRLQLSDIASHESDAQFTLAQLLSLDEENDLISVTQIDGDGTMSIASRRSVEPPVPFPSPITPLNIIGAYPSPITPLSINKEKKRLPSEQSSAGSGFASYFRFGGSRKAQGLVIGLGSGGIVGRRGGSRTLSRSLGMLAIESVSVEEVELEDML